MDTISKSIAKNIKNGQYFIDARKWYFYKYIYPFSERSVLLIFGLGFIAGLLVILYYGLATLPISKEISFIIEVDNSVDYYSRIYPISNKYTNSEDDLAEYMASYYVTKRETYDYETLREQLEIVKNNSTINVFNDFSRYMSLSNTKSPVIILQKINKRYVTINKIEKIKNTRTMFVYFSDKIISPLNTDIQSKNWVAHIDYDIPNLNNLAENDKKLNFVVTNYSVREDNGSNTKN